VRTELPLSIFTLIAAAGLSACKEDSDPFLPLEQLCPALAEDICDAQGHCDCGEVDADCQERVEQRCDLARKQFTEEAELTYDGQKADAYRDAQNAALGDCGAPLPLGGFFEGTRANDEPCDRDAQCESLSCVGDPGRCAAVVALPLCEWDDM
jgi:hypothetical protein